MVSGEKLYVTKHKLVAKDLYEFFARKFQGTANKFLVSKGGGESLFELGIKCECVCTQKIHHLFD